MAIWYIHTHTHSHTHTRTHALVHAHARTRTHSYTHTHVHTRTCNALKIADGCKLLGQCFNSYSGNMKIHTHEQHSQTHSHTHTHTRTNALTLTQTHTRGASYFSEWHANLCTQSGCDVLSRLRQTNHSFCRGICSKNILSYLFAVNIAQEGSIRNWPLVAAAAATREPSRQPAL